MHLSNFDAKFDERVSFEKVILPVSPERGLYRSGLKRALDLFLILATAPLTVPVILVLAALVALEGGKPFYTQFRVGRNGKLFRMWKLRSMVQDADTRLAAHLASDPAAQGEWETTQKLKNDPRITRFGRLLRKTSLDELPQLFNVLNGSMSLVGPRPMMVGQQCLYDGRAYYNLRPGITGLWQISDRNDCNFSDRARFDNAYHRDMSLLTDLRILFRTVSVVLRGTGY
jgi:lipopolysaccharide/colanic/teichoic acid biosynthesis glycosyltransferase